MSASSSSRQTFSHEPSSSSANNTLNPAISSSNKPSCSWSTDCKQIATTNKLRYKDELLLQQDRILKQILVEQKCSNRDCKQIRAARGIEVRTRAKLLSYATTNYVNIEPGAGKQQFVEAEAAIADTVKQIYKEQEVEFDELLKRELDNNANDPHIPQKTGSDVYVRSNQPRGTARILEEEYQHGFKVTREKLSNGRGPLGFWRKRIPEALLNLVVPDEELFRANSAHKAEATIASQNSYILTFLAWIVWKFFYYYSRKGLWGMRDALQLLPPWRCRILHIYSNDLLVTHGYALSSVKNMLIGVRDWMQTYAAQLVRFQNEAELAAWPKQMEKVTSKWQKVGKRYDATKAKPMYDIASKWEKLNSIERTIMNVWCQIGCRWDTFAFIKKENFAVLPAYMCKKEAIPERRQGKNFFNFSGDLAVNEVVSVFIEKEKISSHEGRWIPFECNCVRKEDTDVFYCGGRIDNVLKKYCSRAPDPARNSDFCLYHGKYGFKFLQEHVSLPANRALMANTLEKIGVTFHSPRRNAAIWMALMLFRRLKRGAVDVFLRDIGWATIAQMIEYAPKWDILLYEAHKLYPLHGKLFLTWRAPAKYPTEICSGKNNWTNIMDKNSIEQFEARKIKMEAKQAKARKTTTAGMQDESKAKAVSKVNTVTRQEEPKTAPNHNLEKVRKPFDKQVKPAPNNTSNREQNHEEQEEFESDSDADWEPGCMDSDPEDAPLFRE